MAGRRKKPKLRIDGGVLYHEDIYTGRKKNIHQLRAIKFLNPYSDWPIADFGPDELRTVQKALLDSEYKSGKTMKRYTRRGINDTINCIKSAWRWGLGRGLVRIESVEVLKEVKPLKTGQDNVHENHRRGTITEKEFRKVLAKANAVVGDMLRLIWLTAMRPLK